MQECSSRIGAESSERIARRTQTFAEVFAVVSADRLADLAGDDSPSMLDAVDAVINACVAREEVSAQATLWYEPTKKLFAPCPGWLSGMEANRFTYIPRPNWTRRAISRPKAQPRAARFLRSLLARTAPGTGATAAFMAAGSSLLTLAIAHLRPMAPVRLLIAAPELVAGVYMRDCSLLPARAPRGSERSFADGKPLVEVARR